MRSCNYQCCPIADCAKGSPIIYVLYPLAAPRFPLSSPDAPRYLRLDGHFSAPGSIFILLVVPGSDSPLFLLRRDRVFLRFSTGRPNARG